MTPTAHNKRRNDAPSVESELKWSLNGFWCILVRSGQAKEIFLSTKNHCVTPRDVSCNRHNHWKNILLTLGGALGLRFGCYCFRRIVETLLNDFSEKDILAQNSEPAFGRLHISSAQVGS